MLECGFFQSGTDLSQEYASGAMEIASAFNTKFYYKLFSLCTTFATLIENSTKQPVFHHKRAFHVFEVNY